MKPARWPLLFLCLILALTSMMCSIFTSADSGKITEQQKKATVDSLQVTVSAMQKTAITATPEPTKEIPFPTMVKPPSGSITGKISYPAESIPPLRVVAIKVDSGEYFSTEVFSENTFRLDELPAGKYHVLAYLAEPADGSQNMAGGYTQSVLCGLNASCTDHTLIDVEVAANSNTPEINPADWYAPAGTLPADPTR